MAASSGSLRARTVRGMGWAYGSYVGGRALVFVSTAILARLLTPSDFGLVALALTFMAFLDMVSDLGMSGALIVTGERDLDAKATTVFLITTAMGVLLAAATWALGPAVAALYHREALRTLFPVLGISFLVESLGQTHYALAQRGMDFRSRTKGELSDVVVRGATGIALALSGAGAWALVGGYLAGSTARTAVMWLVVPWRPRARPRREHLRELAAFGSALTGVSIVAALTLNLDKLIIGRALGSAAVGLYSLASRLPELLIINLTIVAGKVLLPAFASVPRERLAAPFLAAVRYTLLLVAPVGVYMIVMARPTLRAAFGDQWRGAAPAMRLFTVMAVLSPITIMCGTVWKSLGRASTLLRFSVLELVTLVPAIALLVDHGITAVAACQAGSTVLVVATGLPWVMHTLGVPARRLVEPLRAVLPAAVAMAAALVGVERLVTSPLPALALSALVGAAVYLGVLRLVAPGTITDVAGTLAPRLRRTPPPDPAREEDEPTAAAVLAEGTV